MPYLDAINGFCRWLVQDRRMLESPVDHLAGGNVRLDRRHDRQILDEGGVAATHQDRGGKPGDVSRIVGS